MVKRTVNPLIRAMNEGIANHKEQAKRSMENAKQALSVKAMLRAKYASIFTGTAHDDTHISFSFALGEPHINVYLWGLDSFKDERLTTLLERLLDHAEPDVKEYAEALNKDYRFDLGDTRVQVCAYVKSDSATCRKVQIDTKTVEQPVYKIICG
jgi:hypothetical protein